MSNSIMSNKTWKCPKCLMLQSIRIYWGIQILDRFRSWTCISLTWLTGFDRYSLGYKVGLPAHISNVNHGVQKGGQSLGWLHFHSKNRKTEHVLLGSLHMTLQTCYSKQMDTPMLSLHTQATTWVKEITANLKRGLEKRWPLFKLFTLVRHFGTLPHFVRHYGIRHSGTNSSELQNS